MTVHRIKLKDLDEKFLDQLRQTVDENAELALWLPEKRADQVITETDFWRIISLLDWKSDKEESEVIALAVKELAQLPVVDIKGFADILSEKLFLLDGPKYADHTGENAYGDGQHFSADTFLYARCHVVANGREFYEEVLSAPEKMPKDLTFEALLSLPRKAYQLKTGEPYQYIPAFIYETFANSDAWGGQSLFDKILSPNA